MSKSLILAFLFILAIGIGFYLRQEQSVPEIITESAKLPTLPKQLENGPIASKQIEKSEESINNKSAKFEIPSSPEVERMIQGLSAKTKTLLEKNNLLGKYKKLAPHFTQDESGKKLLLITTLKDINKSQQEEKKLLDDQLQEMAGEPAEAMLSVGIALKRMGHEFPGEKQYLINLIQDLDVPLEEKTELLTAEAKRPYDPSDIGSDSRKDAISALSVLINLYEEKEKYLHPIVRDIVEAHKENQTMQKMLIDEYAKFHKAHARELLREAFQEKSKN